MYSAFKSFPEKKPPNATRSALRTSSEQRPRCLAPAPRATHLTAAGRGGRRRRLRPPQTRRLPLNLLLTLAPATREAELRPVCLFVRRGDAVVHPPAPSPRGPLSLAGDPWHLFTSIRPSYAVRFGDSGLAVTCRASPLLKVSRPRGLRAPAHPARPPTPSGARLARSDIMECPTSGTLDGRHCPSVNSGPSYAGRATGETQAPWQGLEGARTGCGDAAAACPVSVRRDTCDQRRRYCPFSKGTKGSCLDS